MKCMKKWYKKVLCLLILCFTFINVSAQKSPVTYKISPINAVKIGQTFTMDVNFTTYGDWYIYAPVGVNEDQGMIETVVSFDFPKGITMVGKTEIPKSKPKGSYEIYSGKNIIMSQKFRVLKGIQKGTYTINVNIRYQTCNKAICLPPQTEKNKIIIHII